MTTSSDRALHMETCAEVPDLVIEAYCHVSLTRYDVLRVVTVTSVTHSFMVVSLRKSVHPSFF